jgi:hypothetical protein
MKHHSVCTLGLALALASHPGLAQAASHCKGLTEAICGTTAACRWNSERKVGDMTKAGKPAKTDARAHCRLDVAAAAKIAADMAGKGAK